MFFLLNKAWHDVLLVDVQRFFLVAAHQINVELRDANG
jgi:hypothetical protein